MTRRPGRGGTRRQATVRVVPADLDRSLRLLEVAQLEWLLKAATEEDRRRGFDLPGHSAQPSPLYSARGDDVAANVA